MVEIFFVITEGIKEPGQIFKKLFSSNLLQWVLNWEIFLNKYYVYSSERRTCKVEILRESSCEIPCMNLEKRKRNPGESPWRNSGERFLEESLEVSENSMVKFR